MSEGGVCVQGRRVTVFLLENQEENLVLLVLKRRREVGHVPRVTPFMGVK